MQLAAPAALVVAAALLGTLVSQSSEGYFIDSLVKVSIVVALYVFIGNSGVLSFGHVSFVALGAWVAGVLSVPVSEKPAIMPNLAGFLRDRTVGNVPSLALAALVGGVFALVVGLALMRLSGLAAGIATFAVLEITHNVLRYYEKIGPGLNTFSSVPETTGLWQATIGALLVIGVAFAYQRSRFGRLLRATREDSAAASAVGVSVYRQRLGAFVLSGVLAGFAGGLYVHLLPVNTESVYLDLTFITLAMLVVGGVDEPLGRSRRRARGERARLVPRAARRTASRSSAARSTCPRARGSSSSARSWRSCSSPARAGSPAAASSRSDGCAAEPHLRRGSGDDRQPARRASRDRRGRLGAHAARGARARAERGGDPRLGPRRLHGARGGVRGSGAARRRPRHPRVQGQRPRRARTAPRRALRRRDA